MKLYATVSSERASKGQGGNERLEVEVMGADRESCIARLVFQPAGDDIIMMASLLNGYQTTERIKGEKQKGEYVLAPKRDCNDGTCGRCIACLKNQ